MKNIYHLKLTEKGDDKFTWDCYDEHVVIADTSKEARELCPHSDEGDIWTDSMFTKIKKIGETERKKSEVVISSFNAG